MSVAKKFQLFYVAAIISVAFSECTGPWEDCGSQGGQIGQVCINERCGEVNCLLWYTFTPDQKFTNMTQSICAEIAEVCIPFPLPQPDLCKIIRCPVQPGRMYNVTLSSDCDCEPHVAPPMSLNGEYHVTDKSTADIEGYIVCIKFPLSK